MSTSGKGSNGRQRPVEERAEDVMERAVKEGARLLGRIREEVEDIVAEARTMHERSGSRSKS